MNFGYSVKKKIITTLFDNVNIHQQKQPPKRPWTKNSVEINPPEKKRHP